MKIWAHMLVKNEERYIWFSIMSVINFVDRILVWDDDSSDNTVRIIEDIQKNHPGKIDFKQVKSKTPEDFTKIRQQMLEATSSDWFIIVDGDEVWWDEGIEKVTSLIKSKGNLESIVNRYYNMVGDIYHLQEETAGLYSIDGEMGHLTIRAVNRSIPGLSFSKPHGQQAITDLSGNTIQERDRKKRIFLDQRCYMHFTNMVRSKDRVYDQKVMKRNLKLKHELGSLLPLDFYYPEAFFLPRPGFVSNPWQKIDFNFYLKALYQTPLRKLKRRLFKSKVGY